MAEDQKPRKLSVVGGGQQTLSPEQSRALARLASVIRSLPPQQAGALVDLVEEFGADGYLQRMRAVELPAVKILAEVINGWEPDGVYEFARAWASTLVAREDGFEWDRCNEAERRAHRQRVLAELARRGY
jgi:hypothetical protein